MKKIAAITLSATLSAALLAMGTTSCSPIGAAVGTGAAIGTAASREGGVGQAWDDAHIAAYINDAWFRHSTEMFSKLDLTILEGRVLITGAVQKPEHRDAAVRFAWQAPYVRQVINEIRVEPSEGITGYAKDSWIIAQLRTKLIADSKIESINYKFDSDKGNIYLLGVARDHEERERVINHARNISYVKEVISYVRLRTDPRPDEAAERAGTGKAAPSYSSTSISPSSSSSSASSSATAQDRAIGYNSDAPAGQQLQPIDLVPSSSASGSRGVIQSEDLAPPAQ